MMNGLVIAIAAVIHHERYTNEQKPNIAIAKSLQVFFSFFVFAFAVLSFNPALRCHCSKLTFDIAWYRGQSHHETNASVPYRQYRNDSRPPRYFPLTSLLLLFSQCTVPSQLVHFYHWLSIPRDIPYSLSAAPLLIYPPNQYSLGIANKHRDPSPIQTTHPNPSQHTPSFHASISSHHGPLPHRMRPELASPPGQMAPLPLQLP
jgi:hypothetical protein